MLKTAVATVFLLLSVLQPLVQTYPTWYHYNGQYGVPDYSARSKIHYLQEGQPVHTPNAEYRLHRGYPQWDLPYDTVVKIPLLNSISQRLSAYMQTTSHLRDRLAAMGWHGAKSNYHHPYRPNRPFIRPSHMGHDQIRPSAINPDQQAGGFDNGLDGGWKKILGSLPHYMILEATPTNKKPEGVPKYDSLGGGQKSKHLTTTAIPKLSTERSQEKDVTPSTASTAFNWKLETSESPKFVVETTTSRISMLEGNQNASSPPTQLEEKSTATSPSTVSGKDTTKVYITGQGVGNYTVAREKTFIVTTPAVNESTTIKEEIAHTTLVNFSAGTGKSILKNTSAADNPYIPIISLSGEDLNLIEGLKPGLQEEEKDTSGFISKGESIYIEFPEAGDGKEGDDRNVKGEDNITSGILKLLKELLGNGNRDVTPATDLTHDKPGSAVEGRTEVSDVYYDNVTEESYNKSETEVARGIVRTDGVEMSTNTSSLDEPTTASFGKDTDYDVHTVEYNTGSTTVLNHDEVTGRQLTRENATMHITTLSSTEPNSKFPSELDERKEVAGPIPTSKSTETVPPITTEISTVGQDTTTVPSTATTFEDVTVTTERHHQGKQELSHLDEDVRITSEHHEELENEGKTEIVGVTSSEDVTVTTELLEEIGKEGTTDSLGLTVTANSKNFDQEIQEGRTLAEDVEVRTEPHVLANTTRKENLSTPQQPKQEIVNKENDEDLNTTVNYANEFTTEYTTEILVQSTTDFTSQGESVEYTTQVMEIKDHDGDITTKPSDNETAHTEGIVNTTEYFTSTETRGTNDSVTEIIEAREGEVSVDMDMGQDENVTPAEEHSTDLPQTILTDPSPDVDQDNGLINITRETVKTTAFTVAKEKGKQNAVTKRTSESTSQMVATTFRNLIVEKRTEYLTEKYTTISEITTPLYEGTDSMVQFTDDTRPEGEGTKHFTEDTDLSSTSYPTTYRGLDGDDDDVQPASTLAYTKDLSIEGGKGNSESSTERKCKERISSHEAIDNKDGLKGETITLQEDNTKDNCSNKHEYGSSFYENNTVKGKSLNSSHKSEILTTDIYVKVTEETNVNQTGTTPQPVEDEATLTAGWELETSTIAESTTQIDYYNDKYTIEGMQTESSVEGSQDLSVQNPRKDNANSSEDMPEIVTELLNFEVEESLKFSTDYAEKGETFTTEITTQADIEEGTSTPQPTRNIFEEISTNEQIEFTTVEREDISTVETPEFSTRAPPTRSFLNVSSPNTTEERTSSFQQQVNEETSAIHQEEHISRKDDGLVLGTTVRGLSSTGNASVIPTQTTIAAETTERDEQTTAWSLDDVPSNRDDLDVTTHAILEETTTNDEGTELPKQDNDVPLISGEETVVTTNSPLNNETSTVEQNRQLTTQSPLKNQTSTVQQGTNITLSSTSEKDIFVVKEEKEIKIYTSGEEASTVENDLKHTTNTGIRNIDASTENYVPMSTMSVAEDSSTVQEDTDLATQEFETTTQNTLQEQDESHTVTEEQEITTKKLAEEENTTSPDIKVSIQTILDKDKNISTSIQELENASQKISGEKSLTTETVPEPRTQADIENAIPTDQYDFETTTKATDDEETFTVEEEPEFEIRTTTTTFPPDEETSTPDIETTTERIDTVTAIYEAYTILDMNPPEEKEEASTRSSILKSNADSSRRSDIEIDDDNHHGSLSPYADLLQAMFHGMSSSTEKISSFTTENNANADDIDVRIAALQHLTTNSEDFDERSGRTLISNYNRRKENLFQEKKIILNSSTAGNDDSVHFQNETTSTAINRPDSKFLTAVQPDGGTSKNSQKDIDLFFEEPLTMSPISAGETSTTERLKLNQISTVHLNTLEYPHSFDEEPNPDEHQPTFNVWELLELIPVIIEELRNGHITEEEYEVFGEIFGDLWPVLVAEAKGSVEREDNGQPGIGEMLSKIMEDQEMQELMAERHRRNQNIFENKLSPLLTALVRHRNGKVQSWRPLPGGSGITRVFSPRFIGRTTPRKRNVQPSDFSEETQETRNIIRRLKNVKMDTWLMLWDILSGSEYFRGERDVDGRGHSEAEIAHDRQVRGQKYFYPNKKDDTENVDEHRAEVSYYDEDYSDDLMVTQKSDEGSEMGDEYRTLVSYYDEVYDADIDDNYDDDPKIKDFLNKLPHPPRLRED